MGDFVFHTPLAFGEIAQNMKNESSDRETDDDRSPFAIGYAWAMRITGIGIESVLPCLGGIWIDRRLGTVVLFTFLGLLLGGFIGFMHLLKIVRETR
jgi:F0F1-type ATP synthase assembly protein I